MKTTWIPVCPCSMQETIDVDPLSTTLVKIAIKDEFMYKENAGCMVRITKWTGRDSVPHIQIRTQTVTLDSNCCMEVEVRNPFPDKKLFLQRLDKIACVSVLSGPLKQRLYSRDESPESMETSEKRWFKVSSVVLHRKGSCVTAIRCLHLLVVYYSNSMCCLLFAIYQSSKVRFHFH